jgi:hypothetical protein
LLQQTPATFLLPFHFPISNLSDMINWHVVSLFLSFTRNTWLVLQEKFLPRGMQPNPNTLQEAMEVWTATMILSRLGNRCTFSPSAFGLRGNISKKVQQISFKDMRLYFFPLPGASLLENTLWGTFATGNGYIAQYHDLLEEKKTNPDDIQIIHDNLDEIFGHLQCLPHKSHKNTLWTAIQGRLSFVANSKYYQLKEIGASIQLEREWLSRPQIGARELSKRLNGPLSCRSRRKRDRKDIKSLTNRELQRRKRKKHASESLPFKNSRGKYGHGRHVKSRASVNESHGDFSVEDQGDISSSDYEENVCVLSDNSADMVDIEGAII